MRIMQALPGIREAVTEAEVNQFLENSKLNIQLATSDEDGCLSIQPVWFLYDKEVGKIYVGTNKMSKKVQNMQRNPDKTYFSIDDEGFPYKGVKGKAVARISEDISKNTNIMEKINLKYLGTLEHPWANNIMENTRNGTEIVIELRPKYFSAWDFSKVI